MDLLKKMLAIDPKQRITAKDALLHPFLGQVQVQPFSVLPPSLLPVLQPQNNK
jgi:serine/threonine protein kinase